MQGAKKKIKLESFTETHTPELAAEWTKLL